MSVESEDRLMMKVLVETVLIDVYINPVNVYECLMHDSIMMALILIVDV